MHVYDFLKNSWQEITGEKSGFWPPPIDTHGVTMIEETAKMVIFGGYLGGEIAA